MSENGLMFGRGAKELTSKFKVQDGHLIYKRRIKLKQVLVDYDISQIPYIFVLYGTGGRYSSYTVEGPYAIKVPFVVICKTVRFWLLDTFDCSGRIIDSHYKDEWLGVFLYKDICNASRKRLSRRNIRMERPIQRFAR